MPPALHWPTWIALGVVAFAPPPDSWSPFSDQRVVSPLGKRYVVIKKNGGAVTFEYCERAADAKPMTAAKSPWLAPNPVSVDRDPADRLRAQGNHAQLPLDVIVPDRPEGFLLFDQYAGVGYGQTVTWIDAAGAPTFSLKLAEIFGAVPAKAVASVSSLWWETAHWLDEARGCFVVVSVDDEVREIALPGGAITTPDAPRLAELARQGGVHARSSTLDVLSRRPAAELKDVLPLAMTIFHAAAEPLEVRVRAAVLLHRAGTPVACGKLFEQAIATDLPDALRRYAVRHLPDVLGTKAIPILREQMRGKAGPTWDDARHAFVALGDPAVPTLLAMLGERSESADYRGGAAFALGDIRNTSALDALLDATARDEDYVANAALNAAVAIGSEKLSERLIAILAAGSTQDGRIALHLREHPDKAALPAIEAALLRAKDNTDREWLLEARAACR